MTAEKVQHEAEADGNGPQSQDPQLPSLPPYQAVAPGTKPAQDQSLPPDLIQIEEQTPYARPA